jgi:hypothetical protein
LNEVSEYFENIHVEVDVTRAMLKGPSRPPNMSCIAWQLRTHKSPQLRPCLKPFELRMNGKWSVAILLHSTHYDGLQMRLGGFLAVNIWTPPRFCVKLEMGSGEYRRNIERMRNAEQAFSEWIANERITGAKNTRPYQAKRYSPGEMVYVWRVTGPVRVLALETRLTAEGNYGPRSVVWLSWGSRLIKAVPEQLRKASVREECLELVNPPHLPWTFARLADDIYRA